MEGQGLCFLEPGGTGGKAPAIRRGSHYLLMGPGGMVLGVSSLSLQNEERNRGDHHAENDPSRKPGAYVADLQAADEALP